MWKDKKQKGQELEATYVLNYLQPLSKYKQKRWQLVHFPITLSARTLNNGRLSEQKSSKFDTPSSHANILQKHGFTCTQLWAVRFAWYHSLMSIRHLFFPRSTGHYLKLNIKDWLWLVRGSVYLVHVICCMEPRAGSTLTSGYLLFL